MTTNPTDGRHANSARTLSNMVDAWVEVFATGKTPTREDIIRVAGVSRATVPRLTSMPELAVLGFERVLAQQKVPITTLPELDAFLTERIASLTKSVTVRRDTQLWLSIIENKAAEIRRCLAVRQRWIEQGR